MSLKLHHLNDSRSIRILWLLEEAELPYELIPYQRDKETHLAPAALKAIHPLGKSPVLEDNGRVVVESGAIVEHLITRYAPHLAPVANSDEYLEYLQWIHFAESSVMLPVLLKVFNQIEQDTGTTLNFLDGYADIELNKVLSYLDNHLESREYMVGSTLTGADIMMGFVVSLVIDRFGLADQYRHIQRYVSLLGSTSGWKKAQDIEKKETALSERLR